MGIGWHCFLELFLKKWTFQISWKIVSKIFSERFLETNLLFKTAKGIELSRVRNISWWWVGLKKTMKLHITGSPKWLGLVLRFTNHACPKKFLNLGTTVNNGKRWGSRNDPREANLKRGEQSQSDWLLVHTNGFDGSGIHGMMFFLMKEKDHRNERIRNQSSANKYLKMERIIFQTALHLGNLCTCWLGFNPTVCWVLGSSKKFGRFLGYWRTISLVCLLLYRI